MAVPRGHMWNMSKNPKFRTSNFWRDCSLGKYKSIFRYVDWQPYHIRLFNNGLRNLRQWFFFYLILIKTDYRFEQPVIDLWFAYQINYSEHAQ